MFFLWFSVVFFIFMLFALQHRMIYFPRRYSPLVFEQLGNRALQIHYKTDQGEQTAFYLPPRSLPMTPKPAPVWLIFGGNASLALDWLTFGETFPDKSAHFLLIDYPGFGACQGSPSPQTIDASSVAALNALAQHLHTDKDILERNLNVLGQSIGAAAGLLFAVKHPVRRVVLLSPFTNMMDMARLSVGQPLCFLLRHRYDNTARIHQLQGREQPPQIFIIHGDADEVIPVGMSRQLATMFPDLRYKEIVGAKHNDIMDTARSVVLSAMQ